MRVRIALITPCSNEQATLAPDSLRLLGDAFAADPALGPAGGAAALVARRGRLVVEDIVRGHVRGATRADRREAAALRGHLPEPLGLRRTVPR